MPYPCSSLKETTWIGQRVCLPLRGTCGPKITAVIGLKKYLTFKFQNSNFFMTKSVEDIPWTKVSKS